ncbi:MAG: M67 family metallopeptidase [Cyanobacteriota bacterium]
MLHLAQAHWQAICTHAERTYPQECCGLLLGHAASTSDETIRTVVELWAAENAWNAEAAALISELLNRPQMDHSKGDRYWIEPAEMLAAMKHGRDRQLDIIGVYHSHPDHPAVPSACDRAIAWPHYSYIIVSVSQGSAQDLLSWNLDQDRDFQAEPLICSG